MTKHISSFATKRGLANTLSRLPGSISILFGDVSDNQFPSIEREESLKQDKEKFIVTKTPDLKEVIGSIKTLDVSQNLGTIEEKVLWGRNPNNFTQNIQGNNRIKLSITHTELYLQNLPEALLGIDRDFKTKIITDIGQILFDFDIYEETLDPLSGESSFKLYKHCQFVDLNKPQSIESGVIIESANLTCGYIV